MVLVRRVRMERRGDNGRRFLRLTAITHAGGDMRPEAGRQQSVPTANVYTIEGSNGGLLHHVAISLWGFDFCKRIIHIQTVD